jgi:hypothetical protein
LKAAHGVCFLIGFKVGLMKRIEAVVLISRALSLSWGVSALYEASYLPERLFSYVHYHNGVAEAGPSPADFYLPELYRLAVAFVFVRFVGYLLLAIVFWRCGPWVERTLSPEITELDVAANGAEGVTGS